METHRAAWVLITAGVWLTGCGYPGEPLPPSLNRPLGVRDLSAVEHGDRILIHFTIPKETTEGLPLKAAPDLELRVGQMPANRFDILVWEQKSTRSAAGEIHVAARAASAEIPAKNLYGQTVVIGVRVHGPGGRDVGWSNFEVVPIVPALAAPEALEAKDALDAVRLEWRAAAPEYRIFRKNPDEADFALLGTSTKPEYLDTIIEFGRAYRYFVQSVEKTGAKYAESEVSGEIAFKPTDRFPPAVPAGLTAVPGTRTIELVWERNTEKDFAFYQIYRDGKKVLEGQSAPAFSDRDVKAGVRYRYQVSATDTAGNESALSDPVDTGIP